MDGGERIERVRAKFQAIMAGHVDMPEPDRLFAPWLPEHDRAARQLTARFTALATEKSGIDGAEAAVDEMLRYLGNSPAGMVEHAAEEFLKQCEPARQILRP